MSSADHLFDSRHMGARKIDRVLKALVDAAHRICPAVQEHCNARALSVAHTAAEHPRAVAT